MTRQPVIILERGRRASVPYSVFPIYHVATDPWPSTECAMFHGTQTECEAWVESRAEHVVLYGQTVECSDWFDQCARYAGLVNGRPLPERCVWRPPEEREQELRERTEADQATRLAAVESLRGLLVVVGQQLQVILRGDQGDSVKLTEAFREAANAFGRHTDAHQRLAKLQLETPPAITEIAAEFQAGHAMLMTQAGALARWISDNSVTAGGAILLCVTTLGMDEEHARAAAGLAGFDGAEREQ